MNGTMKKILTVFLAVAFVLIGFAPTMQQANADATLEKPEITSNLQTAQFISAGTTETLSISASADNVTLYYQWYKDGTAISGATSNSYKITNATNAASGTYYCEVVAKDTGETSDPVKSNECVVEVGNLYTPKFTTNLPTVMTGIVAEDISLTVAAGLQSGSVDGTITYQWYKDGTKLNGNDATSATYTLVKPDSGNSGSYWCVATLTHTIGSTNKTVATTANSNTCVLTVGSGVPVPTFTTNLTTSANAKTGSKITLTVAVTGYGSGKLKFEWYYNDADASSHGTATTNAAGNSSSFVIPSAATSDAGNYRCKVTNEVSGKSISVKSNTLALGVSDNASTSTGGTSSGTSLGNATYPCKGTIKGVDVKFRKGTSTTTSKIRAFANSEQLTVLGYSGNWYHVKDSKGVTGYVWNTYCILGEVITSSGSTNTGSGGSTVTPTPVPTIDYSTQKYPQTGYVNATDVSFRSSPSTASSRLMRLSKPTELTVTGYSNGWFAISYTSSAATTTGYMYAQYVTLSSTSSGSTGSGTGTGSDNTVATPNANATVHTLLNLRSVKSYTSDSTILLTMHSGNRVYVDTVNSSGSWYKVTYGTTTGYAVKAGITLDPNA